MLSGPDSDAERFRLMIRFSDIPFDGMLGRCLRAPLRLIPKDAVVPILQGPARGMRWIVGAQNHGIWLGSYEAKKQLALAAVLKAGDVFYDIGANVGFYSLLGSRRVGKDGRVVAFEPLPQNLNVLRRHLSLNHLSNVTAINSAVSDRRGTAQFSVTDPSSSHLSPTGNLRVAVTTLDSVAEEYGLRPPQVVKVDVEGAEIDLIRGGLRCLVQSRPILFIAIHSGDLFSELFGVLHEHCLPFEVRDLDGEVLDGSRLVDEVVLWPLK